MRLRLLLATSLALGGCIGTRDAFLYVALADRDATDYVVLAAERGSEHVPVAYQLVASGSGFIMRSGAWRGRIELVDPATCHILDTLEIDSKGASASVEGGTFQNVSDGPPAPAGLAELAETRRCEDRPPG
jgi:hypothetical protein